MIVGQPRSYLKKFAFVVEIPGVAFAGFQKCSEPKMTTERIEQLDGNADLAQPSPWISPGRMHADRITLERGASKELDLYAWYLQVNDGATGTGLADERFKRTVNIVQQDRDGSIVRRWVVHNAWPSEYAPGELDNTAGGNVIETLVLEYDFAEPSDKGNAKATIDLSSSG